MSHGLFRPRAEHLNKVLTSKANASGMHGPKTNKQRRAQQKREFHRDVKNVLKELG